MVSSLVLSLAASVLALKEPRLRWKPFWAFLALVGVGGGAMAWVRPEQIYWFFGVAVPTVSFASDDASWMPGSFHVLFPLGALLVFLRIYLHRAHRKEVGKGTS